MRIWSFILVKWGFTDLQLEKKKKKICHCFFFPRVDDFILLFSGPWKAFWVLALGAGMVIETSRNEPGSCGVSPALTGEREMAHGRAEAKCAVTGIQ